MDLKLKKGKYAVLVVYGGNKKVLNILREEDIANTSDDLFDDLFRQKGLNFSWHTLSNKLYSMSLWKKARKHYNKITSNLLMTEDFAASVVLFFYANSMKNIDHECLFYKKIESSSTSTSNLSVKKAEKNIIHNQIKKKGGNYSFVADKYVLFPEELEKIMTNLSYDNYIELFKSDKRGSPVFCVSLKLKGEGFHRELTNNKRN